MSAALRVTCQPRLHPKLGQGNGRARQCVARAQTSNDCIVEQGRKAFIASLSAASVLNSAGAAFADYSVFYGTASPPASYGGYGGNAREDPKYSFEYPEAWVREIPTKVEKGVQGIDGRVANPRGKDQKAFVIALTRAGEDNARFQLTDLDSTFLGFTGADPRLGESLDNATNVTKSEREIDGLKFFDYDIDSPDFHYLSTISVKGGKIFALFVRSPARAFGSAEQDLRHMIDTFRLL